MNGTDTLEAPTDVATEVAAISAKVDKLVELLSKLIEQQRKVQNIRVYTVPLDTANHEESWGFPVGTKTFIIHSRNGNALRLANELGNAARATNPYFTLKANTVYDETNLNIDTGVTQKYFWACAVASEVVEILIGI